MLRFRRVLVVYFMSTLNISVNNFTLILDNHSRLQTEINGPITLQTKAPELNILYYVLMATICFHIKYGHTVQAWLESQIGNFIGGDNDNSDSDDSETKLTFFGRINKFKEKIENSILDSCAAIKIKLFDNLLKIQELYKILFLYQLQLIFTYVNRIKSKGNNRSNENGEIKLTFFGRGISAIKKSCCKGKKQISDLWLLLNSVGNYIRAAGSDIDITFYKKAFFNKINVNNLRKISKLVINYIKNNPEAAIFILSQAADSMCSQSFIPLCRAIGGVTLVNTGQRAIKQSLSDADQMIHSNVSAALDFAQDVVGQLPENREKMKRACIEAVRENAPIIKETLITYAQDVAPIVTEAFDTCAETTKRVSIETAQGIGDTIKVKAPEVVKKIIQEVETKISSPEGRTLYKDIRNFLSTGKGLMIFGFSSIILLTFVYYLASYLRKYKIRKSQPVKSLAVKSLAVKSLI